MLSRKLNISAPIQSTAGAVPVKNEKGQVSMQKVKVNRYISGKRPGYAPRSSSEDESEEEEFIPPIKFKTDEGNSDEEVEVPVDMSEAEKTDPRLRRLQSAQSRHRRVEDPEIVEGASNSEDDDYRRPARRYESDSESGDEPLEEDEIERRRAYLRQRALEEVDEEELLTKEEEKDSEVEESDSEYEEEYTDSEEEARPRLKPVFVRKKERVTIKDKEFEEEEENDETLTKKQAEARRRETLKLLEDELKREKGGKEGEKIETSIAQPSDVVTDDENPEEDYEEWKVRELKRIKRDHDEREARKNEIQELERLHGMTEEERRLEMKLRPKVILNKSAKGKYKFLQKYYHRGVFYLDKEETVLKRDYSAPTLEDHFDKTVLPKVMQVKNFGRSGRTKYTHLVDQDTTNFESPWSSESVQNIKFQSSQAAGVRPVFDKPSAKKRKSEPGSAI